MANEISVGYEIDGTTLTLGANNIIALKPSAITQSSTLQDITISSNTTLTSDLYCNNLTINSGVTLTTNGYNIYCEGTFTNNGTINTNYNSATSITTSYGGSGGGGGAFYTGSQWFSGGNGYSTLVSGGAGGTSSSENGVNGSTPSAPSLTNSVILNWYNNGFQNYFSGAQGGYSGGNKYSGGSGGYGIYIQANEIIAGTINANGQNGESADGGCGGGGGGVILLAYGSGGYTAGTYNVNGGAGGGGSGGSGGNGGNGQVLTYNYSSQPIPINSFTYTLSLSYKNKISSYKYLSTQTTSTSPTTIISQSFTPQYTGLVVVKAVVQVSNNTAGDGVYIALLNGSTGLDSEALISTSANQQQIAYLYNEVLYTAPFSQQTFSIQFNVVNGGTANAEIQEFSIEEVY